MRSNSAITHSRAVAVTLDDLADFLNSSNAPPGCMDLSELDGFLAGLAAGPVQLPHTAFLPEIWDNEEPEYRNAEQERAVERAILDRKAEIEAGLDASPVTYAPILWQDEAGTTVAEDWAAGFMQAMGLHSTEWQPALMDEDASALLIPIASLAGMTLTEEERGEPALSDEALEGLLRDAEQILPVCVLGLRRFWRDRAPSVMVRH